MAKSKINPNQYLDYINNGWKKIDIAKDVGLSKQALHNWIRRNKELIEEYERNQDRDLNEVIAEKNREIKKLEWNVSYWKGMYSRLIEEQKSANPSEIEQLELQNGRLLAENNDLKRKLKRKTISV